VSVDRVFSVRGSVNTIYGPFDLSQVVIPIDLGIQLDFRVPGHAQYLPGLV
jgi:hypothetical protein